MTVSSTTNKIRYSGTGSQYIFPYTFKIFEDADLEVILTSTAGVDTVQTLTTHYSVSGAGSGSGGNVTMVTAPQSGEYLTVKRNLDILQETDYVENDPFPAESHENALDRLVMIAQQINEQVDRSIKTTIGSNVTGLTMPSLTAGEYIKVNAAGTGLETTALLTSLGSEAAAVATAIALCVQLSGNQTIAGVKTFSSFPVTPSSAPTTDYQVANKKYVTDSNVKLAGDIVQVVNTTVVDKVSGSANASASYGDGVMTTSMGLEVMTCSITPVSSSNKLLIIAHVLANQNYTGTTGMLGLFQDSTANALASTYTPWGSGSNVQMTMLHYMTAGTTSSTTFKIRAAGYSGSGLTIYINCGNDQNRAFGGTAATTLTIMEIKS